MMKNHERYEFIIFVSREIFIKIFSHIDNSEFQVVIFLPLDVNKMITMITYGLMI